MIERQNLAEEEVKIKVKISEQGYGGFIIIIDLYFKVREAWKKLRLQR